MNPKDIVKHELIGLHVEVVDSTDPSMVGLDGRVIDETRNTLIIEKEDGSAKTIVKENCTLSFEYEAGKRVKVVGKLLVARSEDRIKKKLKKW
ncbi:MAG: ribonuclease P protein component 1 [Nanoarchaeota archaeon]